MILLASGSPQFDKSAFKNNCVSKFIGSTLLRDDRSFVFTYVYVATHVAAVATYSTTEVTLQVITLFIDTKVNISIMVSRNRHNLTRGPMTSKYLPLVRIIGQGPYR